MEYALRAPGQANGSLQFVPSCPGVPAVERALRLLELSAASSVGFTLSEAGDTLGIAKSSAHRLIHTLLDLGYLQRSSEGRRYVLGTRARNLAVLTTADLQLAGFCSQYAEDVSKRLGLNVVIGVRRGSEGVVIFKADSPTDHAPGAWIGRHFELHCTALGKALVAYLTEREIEEVFRQTSIDASLIRYTPSTVCSRSGVLADLARVRTRGFSLNNEESAIGGIALAAPIFSHTRRVVASICVRGSTAFFPPERISSYAKEVVSVATQISRHLS
jgi:IclR family KDG regulon transcriptional repressor